MMLSCKGLIKECNFVYFFYKFLNFFSITTSNHHRTRWQLSKASDLGCGRQRRSRILGLTESRKLFLLLLLFFFIIFPELIKNEFFLTISVHFPTGR